MPASSRTAAIALAANLSLSALLAGGEPPQDWPQFRGPGLDGRAQGLIGPDQPAPRVLWKVDIGIGYTSPSVVGNRIYVAGHRDGRDVLRCLDAATGAPVPGWVEFSYPEKLDYYLYEGGPLASPLIHGGRVYGMSRSGLVYALDATTGSPLWQVDLKKELGAIQPEWGFAGSPRLADGRLLVAVGRFGSSLDPQTGKVLWQTGTAMAGYASPMPVLIDGKRHVLMASAKEYALVRGDDGSVAWELPFRTSYGVNAADPVVAGDRVFIASELNGVQVALESAAPRELWRNKVLRPRMFTPVKSGEHLYGFDDTTLKCVNWSDGQERWKFKGLGESTLLAADGHLIILAKKGDLVIAKADPAGYAEVARTKVLDDRSWVVPAIAGGRIYCRNAKGDLVAVALR